MTLDQITYLNLELTEAIKYAEFDNNEILLTELIYEAEQLITDYYLNFGENVKPLF